MAEATINARSRVTIPLLASLSLGIVSLVSLAVTTVRIVRSEVPFVPFLTPVVGFLGWLLSPFTPFKSAFFNGLFIRLYRHTPFPTQGLTCFTFFGWALHHFEHPVLGVIRLFGDGKNFTGEVCGLGECKGIYLEWGLIFVTGIASWMGWQWDAGATDWVVGKIVKDLWGGEAAEVEERVVDCEKGMVDKKARLQENQVEVSPETA